MDELNVEAMALLGGALVLTVAIVVVLVFGRRPPEPTVRPAPGLIDEGVSLVPPSGQVPGMVGPLLRGEVDDRDLRVTLVDLASRGYLQITEVADGENSDWLLRRTDQAMPDDLRSHEQTLLTASFGPVEGAAPASGSITLSALQTNRAVAWQRAQNGLLEELRIAGWFAEGEVRRITRWGCGGAIVFILGLLTAAYMLINWLANGDFRGVLGGLLVIGAGVLLVSRGRRHGPHTETGRAARLATSRFGEALAELEPQDVDPMSASEAFTRLLPWAAAFGQASHLGGVFAEELRRAARWGQVIDLDAAWFQSDPASSTAAPRELARAVATFISQRPGGRTTRKHAPLRH